MECAAPSRYLDRPEQAQAAMTCAQHNMLSVYKRLPTPTRDSFSPF